jgi:hypothetical protein
VNPNNIEKCQKCGKDLPLTNYHNNSVYTQQNYYRIYNYLISQNKHSYPPKPSHPYQQPPGYHYPPPQYQQQYPTQYQNQTYGAPQMSSYPSGPTHETSSPYYYPPTPSEEAVNRNYNKWLIFSPGVLMPIAGILFMYILRALMISFIFFEAIIAIFYIIIPLVACILMALGYYRMGGLIIFINGILTLPLGALVSLLPGIAAYRFGKLRIFYLNTGTPAPPFIEKRLKAPSRNLRIAAVIGIILVIILPSIYIAYFTNKPDLNIEYANSEHIKNNTVLRIILKLSNNGDATADAVFIKLKFHLTHQTMDLDWNGYGIMPEDEQKGEFELPLITSSETIEKIELFYMGEKVDTYNFLKA